MEHVGFNSSTLYETLKEELLNLSVKPGQTLSENEVCARFGVSRTPVRAAFARLRDDGLLTIVPYKSTFASLLDLSDIEQLIYMRVAIETAVLRDVLDVLDPLSIEKIRYNLRRQAILLESDYTPDDFYRLDSKLHEIWFALLEKDMLWRFIQRAQINYTRFRMLDIVADNPCGAIYSEHLVMFDAMLARDYPRLERLTREHLYGGMTRLGGKISAEFADYFVQK